MSSWGVTVSSNTSASRVAKAALQNYINLRLTPRVEIRTLKLR
jgi:hypothetical protein